MRGYAGTSTLAIATRARVSKRDIYAVFADKRAILAVGIAGSIILSLLWLAILRGCR